MKKSHKSKPFAHDSEYFHTVRIDGPLSENLKAALAEVQKMKECKNRVPVVEIDDAGYFLLIPRQRLATIAKRYADSLPTTEEILFGMTQRRKIHRRGKR